MSVFTNKSKLHKQFSNFVDWIAPEPDKRQATKERIKSIREKIKKKAVEDGLVVMSMPNAGSFAKKTGLRRHYRGYSAVEGQDVDLPFVIDARSAEDFPDLLEDFLRYTKSCYSSHTVKKTKSSIKLTFEADHFSVDIVPLIATDDPSTQVLVRSDGNEVTTSIQKHVDFIRNRIKDSDKAAGRVLFNECVRLFKWWKEFQADKSIILNKIEDKDNSPPSFLIDLLCAKAYDEEGVYKTYDETISKWASCLAHLVSQRKPIHFTDYTPHVKADKTALWSVIDPVATDNNIVKGWNAAMLDELTEWLEESRDVLPRIIRAASKEQHTKAMDGLVQLYGNPFKHHS